MNEFDIFQNKVLASYILWEFCRHFSEQRNESPKLTLVLAVLPMCFNHRIVQAVKGRNFREGSLYRALDENRDLFTGLQERMESMGKLTFESIYLGCVSGLLKFNREHQELQAVPKAIRPVDLAGLKKQQEIAEILDSAKRIGSWFGQMNMSEIVIYLKLKF